MLYIVYELSDLYSLPNIMRVVKSEEWYGPGMWRVWGRGAQDSGGEPEGKRPLGRPRRRWEDNIKMDFIFGHGILQCSPTLTSTQDLFQPNSWQTLVAAVTFYSASEDGRKGRPKHVEHTCSF